MRRAALVLLALLGVLVMHAGPVPLPAMSGHAMPSAMAPAALHKHAPTPDAPGASHHMLSPCRAVLPSGQLLHPAGSAMVTAGGFEPSAPLTAATRAAPRPRSLAPPDLHVLCISRT